MKTTPKEELKRSSDFRSFHDRIELESEVITSIQPKTCVLTTQDLIHLAHGKPIVLFGGEQVYIIVREPL